MSENELTVLNLDGESVPWIEVIDDLPSVIVFLRHYG